MMSTTKNDKHFTLTQQRTIRLHFAFTGDTISYPPCKKGIQPGICEKRAVSHEAGGRVRYGWLNADTRPYPFFTRGITILSSVFFLFLFFNSLIFFLKIQIKKKKFYLFYMYFLIFIYFTSKKNLFFLNFLKIFLLIFFLIFSFLIIFLIFFLIFSEKKIIFNLIFFLI